MGTQGPLRWLDGEGWLVALGGGDWRRGETDIVDAQVLSIANLDRPMVVLFSDGTRQEAEGVLEHYTLLGGPSGAAFTLRDMSRSQLQAPDLLDLLAEAGILYLGGDNPLPLVRNLYQTKAFQYIVAGYTTLQGLIIVGAGGGAAALGAWVAPQVRGLGFLMNALIVPHFTRTEDTHLRETLPEFGPNLLGLGIPDGAALALGPRSQVDTWGVGSVTAVVNLQTEEE